MMFIGELMVERDSWLRARLSGKSLIVDLLGAASFGRRGVDGRGKGTPSNGGNATSNRPREFVKSVDGNLSDGQGLDVDDAHRRFDPSYAPQPSAGRS
jgi:hypothetical protein